MVYSTNITITESDFQIRMLGVLYAIAFLGNLVTYINYNILHAYINYVTQYYGQAVVVFDGDKAGASTKDSTHHRGAGCEG